MGVTAQRIFFENCPNLKKFLSFDINLHPYIPAAVEFFKHNYKEIFEFVSGDSNITVPLYAQQFPEQKFDLFYIDGGHSYDCCLNDLINCKALAHPNSMIWVDDYSLHIREAVNSLVHKGFLKLVASHESSGTHGVRNWAEVRYNFP